MTDAILIHGAWQGAWAWEKVLPELTARGIRGHAVDMPGNGNGQDGTPPDRVSLELYMDHLGGVLDGLAAEGPVVLVGHSSGGIIATQFAEQAAERILGVIFVAGMMLPSDTQFAQLVEKLLPAHPEVAGIIPHLNWSADGETSAVKPGKGVEIFYHDAKPEEARAAEARLKPHPQRGRAITPRWTEARFGRLPRAYIECTLDRSVPLVIQREMQARVPGAKVYTLEAGHAPLLSMPAELTDAIAQAAAGFGLRRPA